MNKKIIISLLVLVAVIVSIIIAFYMSTGKDYYVTTKEEQWLIRMREEEKLARDVYTILGETWGMQIFLNIAKSEQTHTDAVKMLISRYGVIDPVTDDTVGVFTSSDIRKLYIDFIAQGKKSFMDALIVGATIEDLDIQDLDVALSETDSLDIKTVYTNLQTGSRNHMRAFIKNINQQGGSYTSK